MLASRDDLMAYLDQLGIHTETVDHPAAHTVAESTAFAIALPGVDTKNLFVKDSDGSHLLIVARTSAKVDLKAVARRIGVGRLSFASPERLHDYLGVKPGSVTVFAIANDQLLRVKLVLDSQLLEHDSINAHPLDNTATTNIARDDLLRFIRTTKHEPITMAFDAAP